MSDGQHRRSVRLARSGPAARAVAPQQRVRLPAPLPRPARGRSSASAAGARRCGCAPRSSPGASGARPVVAMSRLRANEPCWCGSRAKLKRCHGDHERFRRHPIRPGVIGPMRPVDESITRPPYVGTGRRSPPSSRQIIDGEALVRLRHACRVAAEVLVEAGAAVAPGITTDELDAIAHAAYIARGAYPSTLGYGTYTKSVCTSVNEIVCHGIPDDRPLREGDIVNIDVTAFIDGMHGDTSATFAVGGYDALDEPTRALDRHHARSDARRHRRRRARPATARHRTRGRIVGVSARLRRRARLRRARNRRDLSRPAPRVARRRAAPIRCGWFRVCVSRSSR